MSVEMFVKLFLFVGAFLAIVMCVSCVIGNVLRLGRRLVSRVKSLIA